jgi:hypothetical protein
VTVVDRSCNYFVMFGVETFDICRGSADKLRRAFSDTSQNFFWVRAKRQSAEQIAKRSFFPPDIVNRPGSCSKCGGDRDTRQP